MLNQQNKQSSIDILGQQFQKLGNCVRHKDGDGDLLIVQTALEVEEHHINLIKENNLLILLLCQKVSDSQTVFVTCKEKSNMKYTPITWDIEHAENRLGDKLCDALLAIHGLVGCGVTSRACTIGKVTILNKFMDNIEFQKLVKTLFVFRPPTLIPTSVTGEKTLDELSYSN